MWYTERGDVVLKGAKWELFCEGLNTLWDWIETYYHGGEDLSQTGVEVFDALQPNQKLALLALVGKALKDESVPPPDLTAYTEGAVAAVFSCLLANLECEIDMSGGRKRKQVEPSFPSTRSLILAAFEATAGREEWEGKLPGPKSRDLDKWRLLLQCLEMRILWDFDLPPQQLMDAPSDQSQALMRELAIDPDYFVAPPPDPRDDELPAIRRTLRELTGRPEPKEPVKVRALYDIYHDLFAGPCAPDVPAREEAACPLLIYNVHMYDPDGLDCTYEEWVKLSREEVHRGFSQERPEVPAPEAVLSEEQLCRARQAAETGPPLDLEEGHKIEHREGGWVVVDNRGPFLVDPYGCEWSSKDVLNGPSPRLFATPAEAYAALVWSESLRQARVERYEQALKRLGREE
jgi:hypothetical protein